MIGAEAPYAAEPGWEQAKKEGEVVLYTAWGLDTVKHLQSAFGKKYPFIKVNVLRTRSERILTRTIAEHKQKVYNADVFSGSQLAMLNHKKEGHLQKYVSPQQAAFPKEFKDPEGSWTSFYVDTRVLAYNTRLVAREALPQSYDDLLLPKWKGKMGMDDAEYILYGSLLEIMGREKGLAYMKRLAQQELNLRGGHSLLTQLLVAGEFPLYIDAFGSNIEQFKAQGAPIDWVALEPVIVTLYPVGMAVNAPHPNAARLLIDFLLSKEGQEIARRVGKIPGRSDVEPPYPRMTRGLKLFPVPNSVADRYGEIVKEFREIFLKNY
ncbi:MAG TPA: extracellular solute-binding protein [Candidatus Acidoferrales bacterium]|nr:extracellular solute-binding protein [Candidatus Acidoferrales bacterium]